MRPRTLIFALAVGVAALIHFWPDEPAKPAEQTQAPARASRPESTTQLSGTAVATPQQAPSAAVNAGVSAPRPAGPAPVSELKIDVRAPSAVKPGESFQVTVDLQTLRSLRQLAFAVSYKKSVLQLVGTSPGAFAQQGAAGASFGSDEPSDGSILVTVELDNGAISGAGSVAVFEFQALKPGTSSLSVHSVTFVENGRQDISPARTAYDGTVTVE